MIVPLVVGIVFLIIIAIVYFLKKERGNKDL